MGVRFTRKGWEHRALWRRAGQRRGPEFVSAGPHVSKQIQNLLTIQRKAITKSTQNHSIRLLGAHFGPMLETRSILSVPKTAKNRPRGPKRRPRPSQTPPKWIQRPFQFQFSGGVFISMFLFQMCMDFSTNSRRFVVNFY